VTEADPFELQRFVDAQANHFGAAIEELRQGRKRTHWMWFVFPQMRGLARSTRSHFYGIGSLDEARAYLDHPILGDRLIRATEAVLGHADIPLSTLFGSPDDVKFISSMTLFALADADGGALFRRAIERFGASGPDKATLALLGVDGFG
jgi:uncharacterized protein (DUF1810 family)